MAYIQQQNHPGTMAIVQVDFSFGVATILYNCTFARYIFIAQAKIKYRKTLVRSSLWNDKESIIRRRKNK